MKRYNYIPKNKIIKLPKVRAVITEGLKTKNMYLSFFINILSLTGQIKKN